MNGEGKEALRVDFGRGKWSRSDWIVMKGPRWNYVKEFVQKEDHIQNDCPDVPDEELYSRYVTDVYTSMVYAKTFTAKAEIASVMSFDGEAGTLGASRSRSVQRGHKRVALRMGGLRAEVASRGVPSRAVRGWAQVRPQGHAREAARTDAA